MDSSQANMYATSDQYEDQITHNPRSRQKYHTPNFSFNLNNKFRRNQAPRSYPTTDTDPRGAGKQQESAITAIWPMRQVPNMSQPHSAQVQEANLNGFSYCIPEQPTPMPAWDPSTMTLSSSHEVMPQTYAIVQDFYQPSEPSGSRPSSMY